MDFKSITTIDAMAIDKIARWIAKHLPRHVVFYCGTRMAIEANHDRWDWEIFEDMSVADMIEAWRYRSLEIKIPKALRIKGD